MRAQFPIPTSPTTMIIATMTQDHDAGVGPSRSWIYFNQTYTLLLAGFTLGLPSFHKSLACKESPLGLPDTINVWKATRSFASLLFGALIAMLFSPSVQTNIVIWFLISISLLQAILGLTCSNILIIYFSNRNRHNHPDPVQLNFFFWSVWDLFSVPCVLTAWSAVISTVALIVEIVSPGIVQCGPIQVASLSQAVHSNIARIVLSLSICISGIPFTFFLLHLRHLSCIFSQTTRLSDP